MFKRFENNSEDSELTGLWGGSMVTSTALHRTFSTPSTHTRQLRTAGISAPGIWCLTLLILLFICLLFWDKSLYHCGCPRTCYIDQAVLELTETLLPLALSARIKGVCHHTQADFLLWLLRALYSFLLGFLCIEKIDIGYLLGSWNILSFKHTKNMNIFLIVSNMCERRPLGHFGKRLLGHSGLSSPSPQCCRQNQSCIQAR